MSKLSVPTEEDAFNFIVTDLRTVKEQKGFDLFLRNSMHRYVESVYGIQEGQADHFEPIWPAFISAAWTLCRRGILRPGAKRYGSTVGEFGVGFSLTPFGKQWLEEAGGKYDYIPTEPGRFSQMLEAFAPRFGEGFRERSQEAIRCYGGHAHLACCAMCGAASESVVLALAIAKLSDAAKVESMYLASGGRGRIEKLLLGSKPEQLRTRFQSYLGLLKYWRDNTAHGMPSGIDDNEAYTSLLLLLQFAHFADDRWTELVSIP
jgi:hypothetical protein